MNAFILASLLALQEGIPEADFRTLHDSLRPPTAELWRDIPWKISLVEAQNEAAREKKPKPANAGSVGKP